MDSKWNHDRWIKEWKTIDILYKIILGIYIVCTLIYIYIGYGLVQMLHLFK